MMLPNKPRKGDDLTAWANSVVDCLRAMRITSFVGGIVKQSTGGTALVGQGRVAASDSTIPPGPFEPVLSGNFVDGWEVTVTTGEIRSFEDVTPLASIANIATPLDGVTAGDVVYLKFLNGTSIYYASVHVGSVGDGGEGWEDYPARGKFSASPPYDMTESYLELARVENTDPEDLESPLQLVGVWKSGHIVTQQAFVYGKLGAFAFPGN